IVQLGKRTDISLNYALMLAGVLFHEGRHSDCDAEITESDLKELAEGYFSHKVRQCGYMHSPCPEGHDREGERACDDHEWGAYFFDAIFYSTVAEYCKDCTPTLTEPAHLFALDAFSRVPSHL